MNLKKLYRLYREEGLTVRRRRGRKRATGTRAPITIPQAPNQRWSLDFVADVLSWGGGSGFWRSWMTSRAKRSLGGQRVVRELDGLIARRGRPAMIVSDNGNRADLAGRAGLDLRRRTPGPRATGCATPTSSAGRPLPSRRRSGYEQPGLSFAGAEPKGSRSPAVTPLLPSTIPSHRMGDDPLAPNENPDLLKEGVGDGARMTTRSLSGSQSMVSGTRPRAPRKSKKRRS